MTTKPTASVDRSVVDEARRWAVSLDDISDCERAELEQWLQASPTHRPELERAIEGWQSLKSLRHTVEYRFSPAVESVERKQVEQAYSRRNVRVPRIAAVFVTIALTVWWFYPFDTRVEFSTAVGEQQTITLSDASTVILNTNSRLTVSYTDRHRAVRLEYGEAHFDVAHDSGRPFTVIAGTGMFRAVGTAFSVQLHNEALVEITVTAGEVEILQASPNADILPNFVSSIKMEPEPIQRLTVGHHAKIADKIEAVSELDPETINRELAWREGMLEFVNAPLSEVLDAAGRYTTNELVVTDPELAQRRITVVIKASNIDLLLRSLDQSSDEFEVRFSPGLREFVSSSTRQ